MLQKSENRQKNGQKRQETGIIQKVLYKPHWRTIG
jgi:hypothetical protein